MRLATGLLAALLAFAVIAPVAHADDGDAATLSLNQTTVGGRLRLTLEVMTPPGSTVDVDPAAASWNGVEVVRTENATAAPEGDREKHTIVLLVAPFKLGQIPFAPAVTVTTGAETVPRSLPGLTVKVLATLNSSDPLELSPLAEPVAISGGESPWLKPGLALAFVVGAAAAIGLTFLVVRWFIRRPRKVVEPPLPPIPEVPDLVSASAIIQSDPVNAYRTLSATVRRHIGTRYGFPASALTARELERRMESEGVDRWEARLVGGLLSECDAVVYAGYRPAAERREADVTMAREIVEAGA